jgi:hypothetical protein
MMKQRYWEEMYSPSVEELLEYELWVYQEQQREQIRDYYLRMKERIETGELDETYERFVDLLGDEE